jgi:hypothetical protein
MSQEESIEIGLAGGAPIGPCRVTANAPLAAA